MKLSADKLAVLAATLALCACRPDPLGPTGVQVDIFTGDSRLYATSFILSWMDEHNRLFDVRVPEEGFIDEMHAPAVSVFIAQSPEKTGTRRILVRGFREEQTPVSEAAARILTVGNVWSQLGLPMSAYGSLPDRDADGLPDSVDNCPLERDPCGSGQTVEVDAGPEPAAGADAGADGAADAGAEAGREAGFDPTGFADGGTDLARPRN